MAEESTEGGLCRARGKRAGGTFQVRCRVRLGVERDALRGYP